jgi:hypothetical protein
MPSFERFDVSWRVCLDSSAVSCGYVLNGRILVQESCEVDLPQKVEPDCIFFFFSPTPSSGPLPTRTHTTKDAGGRSSLGPADAVGAVRLMPFLPDDASSPSQGPKPTRGSTGEGACHQMPGASRCPVPLVPALELD